MQMMYANQPRPSASKRQRCCCRVPRLNISDAGNGISWQATPMAKLTNRRKWNCSVCNLSHSGTSESSGRSVGSAWIVLEGGIVTLRSRSRHVVLHRKIIRRRHMHLESPPGSDPSVVLPRRRRGLERAVAHWCPAIATRRPFPLQGDFPRALRRPRR